MLLCNECIEAPSLVSVQEPVRQLTATAKATLLSCIFLSAYVFFVKVRFDPLQPPMPFASLWTATQNPKKICRGRRVSCETTASGTHRGQCTSCSSFCLNQDISGAARNLSALMTQKTTDFQTEALWIL